MPGSGSVLRIRIVKANEYGSGSETLSSFKFPSMRSFLENCVIVTWQSQLLDEKLHILQSIKKPPTWRWCPHGGWSHRSWWWRSSPAPGAAGWSPSPAAGQTRPSSVRTFLLKHLSALLQIKSWLPILCKKICKIYLYLYRTGCTCIVPVPGTYHYCKADQITNFLCLNFFCNRMFKSKRKTTPAKR